MSKIRLQITLSYILICIKTNKYATKKHVPQNVSSKEMEICRDTFTFSFRNIEIKIKLQFMRTISYTNYKKTIILFKTDIEILHTCNSVLYNITFHDNIHKRYV